MTDAELAAAAGIPVPVVRAIRAIESSGNPRAVRFEPHLFNRFTDSRFSSQIPYTGPGASRVRAETDRGAFTRAFALAPREAVRATSWGLYQVLGGHLLTMAATPAEAVSLFDADPSRTSDRLLIAWFNASPAAKRAANAGDYHTLAMRYNGSERWYERFLRALRRAAPSGGSGAALVLIGCGVAWAAAQALAGAR